MRHRITVQSLTETPDDYGQLIKSWTTLGTFWANVRSPTGREALNAAQLKAELTDVIEMRWVGNDYPILPSMQVLFRGRTLKIESVTDPDNRRRQYLLQCREIVLPAGAP